MAVLPTYAAQYPWATISRDRGIVEVALGTDGGPLRWSRRVHRELPELLELIGRDKENRVLILTGTGDVFCESVEPYRVEDAPPPRPGYPDPGVPADVWDVTYSEGKRLITSLAELEIPVVSALNGPAHIHAELLMLGDVIIAANHVTLRDAHVARGRVAGDGAHVVWPYVLGELRGRRFVLLSETMTAEEASRIGAIAEVMPLADLMPRARVLAAELAQLSHLATGYTRILLNQEIKRRLVSDLGYGLALEGLGFSVGQGTWTSPDETPAD